MQQAVQPHCNYRGADFDPGGMVLVFVHKPFQLCALAEPADDSLERYHVRGAYPAGFHRAGVQDQLDGSFHDHAGAGRFALPAVGR